jgi:uncharacterized protein
MGFGSGLLPHYSSGLVFGRGWAFDSFELTRGHPFLDSKAATGAKAVRIWSTLKAMTTAYRPWEAPRRPWVMSMQWHQLLFAHWAVRPAQLELLIPQGLQLETFDGFAWLGVVPFQMRRTIPRNLFSVPGISDFDELNLRTYVTDGTKPGVWFFSLDANQALAVRAARLGFHLPYMDARMRVQMHQERVTYSSLRTHRDAPPAQFKGQYQPTGPTYRSSQGSLEHWLTERYCLYSADAKGRVYRGEIHHEPWNLQSAEAEFAVNTVAEGIGVRLEGAPQTLHFSSRIDVRAWLLERIS